MVRFFVYNSAAMSGNITMNRRGDFLEISDDDGQLKRVLRETGALYHDFLWNFKNDQFETTLGLRSVTYFF